MKRAFSRLLCLVMLLAFAGCRLQVPEFSEPRRSRLYGDFSFAEVQESLDLSAANVKTKDFVNVEEAESDMGFLAVFDRAKAEVDLDYDEYTVSYDPDEDVWMVQFRQIPGLTSWGGSKPYTKRTGNASQTVYLNGKGVTLLIVSGQNKA